MVEDWAGRNKDFLLCRSLSRLSPDIFFHPLWAGLNHLDQEVISQILPECIQLVQESITGGNVNQAGQLLLICAALEKYRAGPDAALGYADQASQLALSNDQRWLARWAYWGLSALNVWRGNMGLAAENLRSLQSDFSADEWVLADLVQIIRQALVEEITPDDLLEVARVWLLDWGENPVHLQADCEQFIRDHFQITGLAPHTPIISDMLKILKRYWRKLMLILDGKLRLEWVEAESVARLRADRRLKTLHPKMFTGRRAHQNLAVSASPPPEPSQSPGTGVPLPPKIALTPGSVLNESPGLVIYCLGSFRLIQANSPVNDWASRKSLAIFKYLVARYPSPVAKEILMDTFWPEMDPEAVRRNLHQAIYSLRQMMRQVENDVPYILFENDSYLINPEIPIWLDFREFETYAKQGILLEEQHQNYQAMAKYGLSESLYQGDFLEEDLYEEWTQLPRQRFRDMYMRIADALSNHYLERGEYNAALAICRKILTIDIYDEAAYRVMMQSYAAQGQRHLAVLQYRSCAQLLKDDLGLSPSEETTLIYRKIIGS